MSEKPAWIGSMFNYCFKFNNYFIVYNTLHTKIYLVDENIFNLLNSRSVINTLDLRLTYFLREHLIVPVNENEIAIAYHYMNQIIYDNQLNVTIIPTQGCNFRCIYCFEEHSNINMSDESESKILRFFDKNIKKYSSVKISWFGGEPLLEKNRVLRIMQRIKQACEREGIPVLADMITNGYLLDLDTFNALISSNVLFYEVTVDGFKNAHDKVRPLASGIGTYDVIVKNLINIQRNSSGKRYRIVIRTNLDKSNADDYLKFVEELEKILKGDKRFEFLCAKTTDWGGETIRNIENNLFSNRNEMASFPQHEDYQNRKYSTSTQSLSQMRCQAGKRHGFVIMPNAELHKCTKISYNSSDIPCQTINKIGSIKSNGNVIFDEEKIAQFVSMPIPYEKCYTCTWFPICILSMCPYRVARQDYITCKLQNEQDERDIHDNIITQFKKGCFINTIMKEEKNE